MAETGAAGGIWTVRRILDWTRDFFARKNVFQPRLSAEELLAHVLGVPRIKLFLNYDRPLSPADLSPYRELVRRAAEDEPIAYLTGRKHFFNLEFEVTRDVLIPRPDTETLVEDVLQTARIAAGLETPRILDLCTGSGCIAAALAHNLKGATVLATDISPAAVAVARRNVERLGLSGRVIVEEGDLFEPLSRVVDAGPFDLIVANPPYIPTVQLDALDRSVRDYEPVAALDGGLDGLTLHRRIMQEAGARVVPGGRVYLEIAFDQGDPALQIASQYGESFEPPRVLKDFAGRDRVLTLRKKPDK
jgi:release factor glutamine methyltransferase